MRTQYKTITCEYCKGSGKETRVTGASFPHPTKANCSYCRGTGKTQVAVAAWCENCGGTVNPHAVGKKCPNCGRSTIRGG
jgi:DnaJ-class molecular chaperone